MTESDPHAPEGPGTPAHPKPASLPLPPLDLPEGVAGAPRTLRLTELKLPLNHPPEALRQAIVRKLGIASDELLEFTVFRRGYDARKKSDIHFIYTVDVLTRDNAKLLAKAKANKALAAHLNPTPDMRYRYVARASSEPVRAEPVEALRPAQGERSKLHQTGATRPVVIGTGPCGLFAALTLAQMGFKPIVLERGKQVRERTKDTWGFWRKSQLKTDSNVQFGEGGAGTFSDGKLYSQVKDPQFHGRKVLAEMVKGGAPEEILYVSKPHVGTFRLVQVVEHLRQTIIALGGEVRFGAQVTDLLLDKDTRQVQALQVQYSEGAQADGRPAFEEIATNHVVLAIGHSARDTFEMLHARGVFVQAKPFSVGFRIEHPQGVIDRARFGPFAGHPELGAADYKLVHHAGNGRSVYSFCMCPGGTVVAATSEEGRVVTNGMSQYSRNERNANAGIVVGIHPEDFDFDATGKPLVAERERGHPLAGVRFQRALESGAYVLGGMSYQAPGQRVGDYLQAQASTQLGSVVPSYKPGVHLTDLTNPNQPALPMYAIEAIREALPVFGRQIAGFDMPDAMLTGVETRTSSPIRIQRFEDRGKDPHPQRYQSINTPGLYPAGEGAGYAGGIMSAAIDGIKVAEAVALSIANTKLPASLHSS